MLPTTPQEMENAARERLSPAAYAFFAAGSFMETSVVENVRAWSQWLLRPRVGVDVREVDLSTSVLSASISMPLFLAPCGFNRLAHPDGEEGVARACAAAGVVQVLSSATGLDPAVVARAASGVKWYQLYADDDPAVTDERIARAAEAGYAALVVTVDTPMLGVRYRGLGDVETFLAELQAAGITSPVLSFCRHLDWREIERIASSTALPVVLKGVLHPEDARRAPDHGARALIVSNHGGRQLDGTIPPALALPEVVEASGDRLEVYVDGGVRTGVDVVRALALGARAVLVGRPYLWALAIGGEAGVLELLERYRSEIANAMALAGQTKATAVDSSIVVRA